MATNGGTTFSQSIFKNILKTKQKINEKCYSISRELFFLIVEQTPNEDTGWPQKANYSRGLLINNWFPQDGPGFSDATTSTKDHTASGSYARIQSLRGNQFFMRDGTVTLSNNISYAFRAEYAGWPQGEGPHGNWKGTRKPYRMVARALIKMAAKYK